MGFLEYSGAGVALIALAVGVAAGWRATGRCPADSGVRQVVQRGVSGGQRGVLGGQRGVAGVQRGVLGGA